MIASMKGHKDVVSRLICQGVDINALSDCQETALSLACQEGFQEVVKLLVKAGDKLIKDKLNKIENETMEFTQKIRSEKLLLQEEVNGLKEIIERNEEVFKVLSKEKEKKIARLESDLEETKSLVDSERRVGYQLDVNNKLLKKEVDKKEKEINTLKKDNSLLAIKITELEEEVREDQAQFQVIVTTARSRSHRAEAQGSQPGLLSSVSGETAGTGGGSRPNQPTNQPPVSSILTQPPVSSSPAKQAASVDARPGHLENNKNDIDNIIAVVVAKFPDLKVEDAEKYTKILRERNCGGRFTLDEVEDLWKNDLGAVGGGSDGFNQGRQTGSQLSGWPGQAEPVEEEELCSICLDPFAPGGPDCKEVKPCKHRFHLHCIQVNSELVSNVLSLMVSIYICRAGSTMVRGSAPTVGQSLKSGLM